MIYPKNLLIVRTDRIGDVILSLPLAGIIKKYFPECRVTFLIREYTRSLAAGNPFIDEILILREKGNKIFLLDNIKQLTKRKFDSAIIVSPTLPTTVMIFFSRIKYRIGTGYRWYSFLLNKKIYEHRKYGQKHELEFNIGLLAPMGIKEVINFDNVRFDFSPDINSIKVIDKVFNEKNIPFDKPVIIIHPGSGGSAVDWPIYNFKELIRLLSLDIDATLIITGSKSEKAICDQLEISGLPTPKGTSGQAGKIINFAGKFNLAELTALINRCDIFISNSTGPIHIAAALNKFTVGFYPKILACSAKRWGPYSNNRIVFTPLIDCSNLAVRQAGLPTVQAGCTRERCEQLNCMDTIKPELVISEIKRIFGNLSRKRRGQNFVKNGELNV